MGLFWCVQKLVQDEVVVDVVVCGHRLAHDAFAALTIVGDPRPE